jgi:hypothetical protein
MNLNGFSQGLQDGAALGASLVNTYNAAKNQKLRERDQALQEAKFQMDNPGTEILDQTKAPVVDQVGGENVYQGRSTNIQPNDEVTDYGHGILNNKSERNRLHEEMAKREIRDRVALDSALDKVKVHTYSPDSIVGTNDQIQAGNGYRVPGREQRIEHVSVAPGHSVGHYGTDGSFVKDFTAPADATKPVFHNVPPGAVVLNENNEKVFENPVVPSSKEETLDLKRYQAALNSVRTYQKLLELDSGDEAAKIGLKAAQSAVEKSAIAAGLSDPDTIENAKDDIRQGELEKKGDPKPGWFGTSVGSSGRTPDQEAAYQEIMRKHGKGTPQKSPIKTIDDLYK